MNLKALFKIIAWNLGILFGGVIIVELIFGGWFGAPQLWSLNIVRDYHVEFNVPDLYRRNDLVHYRKDIWGFRGNYGQVADINIVAFGGSTTEETNVSDNETWPAVLNSCLRQNNINSNMANAGISGQSSVGHILNFSKWLNFIPDFAPKYGVFLIGYNESLGFSDYQDPHNIKGGGTNTKFQAFRKWAKINSALYNFYQVIRGNVKAWNAGLSPLRKIKTYITKSKQTRPSVDSLDGIYKSKRNIEIGSTRFNELDKKIRKQKRELLSAYKKRLPILHQLALKSGISPIYVTQNSWGYWKDKNRIYGSVKSYLELNAFNNVTRDFCRINNIACVDVANKFYFSRGDMFDNIHSTPQGSQKIGMAICSELVKQVQISRSLGFIKPKVSLEMLSE